MPKRKTLRKFKATPELYLIAGPNGSGKTTFARQFLPHFAHCPEFVNADYIATGISPFAPENVALDAGRVMLHRIADLIADKKTFGFETTLAGRGYVKMLKALRCKGYRIHLYFLWLPNASVAIERVAQRVRKGGHNIDHRVVRRRFSAGLNNFFNLYQSLVDEWILWEASLNTPQVIARSIAGDLQVANESLYGKIMVSRAKQ